MSPLASVLCHGRAVGHAQSAPVPSVDDDGGGRILHQSELVAAHVAAVGLYQHRFGVERGVQSGAVVENGATTTVGAVPDRIAGALRLRVQQGVRADVAAAVGGGGEVDTGTDFVDMAPVMSDTSMPSLPSRFTVWAKTERYGSIWRPVNSAEPWVVVRLIDKRNMSGFSRYGPRLYSMWIISGCCGMLRACDVD
ncbi:MAG: hypothetical protein P8015_16410 [Acidihalobacter sp.]